MKKIFSTLVYLGVGILVLGLLIWLGAAVKGGSQPTGPASFSLDRTSADLGEMEVKDEKTAEFILTNNGASSLLLAQFETSCNCTFATVTVAGKKSPTFNMKAHMPASDYYWKTEVAPGAQAKIQVVYQPSLMPVYGLVERSLKFKTSDPNQPLVELVVKAFVK